MNKKSKRIKTYDDVMETGIKTIDLKLPDEKSFKNKCFNDVFANCKCDEDNADAMKHFIKVIGKYKNKLQYEILSRKITAEHLCSEYRFFWNLAQKDIILEKTSGADKKMENKAKKKFLNIHAPIEWWKLPDNRLTLIAFIAIAEFLFMFVTIQKVLTESPIFSLVTAFTSAVGLVLLPMFAAEELSIMLLSEKTSKRISENYKRGNFYMSLVFYTILFSAYAIVRIMTSGYLEENSDAGHNAIIAMTVLLVVVPALNSYVAFKLNFYSSVSNDDAVSKNILWRHQCEKEWEKKKLEALQASLLRPEDYETKINLQLEEIINAAHQEFENWVEYINEIWKCELAKHSSANPDEFDHIFRTSVNMD